ncbi:hypothetical protein Tco_0960858 [Tanacetum coccineum]
MHFRANSRNQTSTTALFTFFGVHVDKPSSSIVRILSKGKGVDKKNSRQNGLVIQNSVRVGSVLGPFAHPQASHKSKTEVDEEDSGRYHTDADSCRQQTNTGAQGIMELRFFRLVTMLLSSGSKTLRGSKQPEGNKHGLLGKRRQKKDINWVEESRQSKFSYWFLCNQRSTTNNVRKWGRQIFGCCQGYSSQNGFGYKETNMTLWPKRLKMPIPIDMLGFFGWLASIKQGMLEPVKVKCIFLGYRKGIVGNKLWRLDDFTSKVVLYRNMGFYESGEYKKTFIGSSVAFKTHHKATLLFVVTGEELNNVYDDLRAFWSAIHKQGGELILYVSPVRQQGYVEKCFAYFVVDTERQVVNKKSWLICGTNTKVMLLVKLGEAAGYTAKACFECALKFHNLYRNPPHHQGREGNFAAGDLTDAEDDDRVMSMVYHIGLTDWRMFINDFVREGTYGTELSREVFENAAIHVISNQGVVNTCCGSDNGSWWHHASSGGRGRGFRLAAYLPNHWGVISRCARSFILTQLVLYAPYTLRGARGNKFNRSPGRHLGKTSLLFILYFYEFVPDNDNWPIDDGVFGGGGPRGGGPEGRGGGGS